MQADFQLRKFMKYKFSGAKNKIKSFFFNLYNTIPVGITYGTNNFQLLKVSSKS